MSPQRTGRRRSRHRGDHDPIVLEGVETLTYDLAPTEVLTEQDIQTIHDASMRLLSETGMLLIDHTPALENLKANGAKVDGEIVKIDEDTLMNFVNLAPNTFTQLARDERNHVPVGGN